MNWRVVRTDVSSEFAIELLMFNGQWFMGEDRYNSVVNARIDARTRYGLDPTKELKGD